MLYYAEIATPAQTLATAPLETRIRITLGIAREQWFMFPKGCAGLVHLQVWHHGWQVWPWSKGGSFHWDNYVFHLQDRYPFEVEPYELVVKTWNEDDSYLHHVTFAMVLDPMPPSTELIDLSVLLAELGVE